MVVNVNISYDYEEAQDSGFGLSLKKVVKRAVKAPKKITKRTVSMVKESGKELKKGHIIKAGSTWVAPVVAGGLTVMNPLYAVPAVARMTSDDKKKIDRMSVVSPLAIGSISDRKLQKKAAIGWGAAAVAVGAAAVIGAGAGASAAAGEAATGAGAAGAGTAAAGTAAGVGAGTLATVGTGLAVASTTVGLAEKTGLIKDKEGQELVEVPAGPEAQAQQPIIAGMLTKQNILIFMGLSALTAIGYMVFSKPVSRG